MSLEHIVADASLERSHYHQLSTRELDQLHDAEALFERGYRLRKGIGVKRDGAKGWTLALASAQLGHPVALAFCFLFGQGTDKNLQRAAELLLASAQRNHPLGSLVRCATRLQR